MLDGDFSCIMKNDKNNNLNFKESELNIDNISFIEFNECSFYKVKSSEKVFHNVQFVDVVFENFVSVCD